MRNTLILPLVLLLSACQLAPPHSRPNLPVASSYPDYGTVKTSETRSEIAAWETFFIDERLKQLINQAFENNRDMTVAVLRMEEAMAAYGLQRSSRLPNVSAGADGLRSRTSVASAGTAAGISEAYALDLSVTAFELDFWGRVRNATKSARSNYMASQEAARAFRLALIREVSSAYLSNLEASARIALAEQTVESRSEQVRIASRRLSAGVTSELEFRQAETLLTQAEAELAALRLNQAQSKNLLSVLIGGSVDGALSADQTTVIELGKQVDTTRLAAGLPSELLESRPDIQAAEQQLIAARANIGVARAAYFPSISLTGSYGYASTDLDTLVGSDGRAWQFGPSIDLPIFDYGRRRATVRGAVAREKIAVAQYEKAIQTAFREVADALAARQFLADQIAAQQRGIIAQRRLAELAQKRYKEGVVRYLEVLDAERNLFAAEQALLQAKRVQTTNAIALYIALGGDLAPPIEPSASRDPADTSNSGTQASER